MTETAQPQPLPKPQTISQEDIRAALAAGWDDFRAAPGFGLAFGAAVTTLGLLIFAQLVVWGSVYWVLPVAAGFPLVGPFAAAGLYEVSRRRATGEALSWGEVMRTVGRGRSGQVPWMAFTVLFFFLVWAWIAHLMFMFAVGWGLDPAASIADLPAMLTTGPGLMLLALGTAVGGVLAWLLFSITVVSVPMLIDREIDVVSAMVTSARTVSANTGVMLRWAGTVAVLTALAMLPAFLGMLILFPVLGHASWHLYRRAVAPA